MAELNNHIKTQLDFRPARGHSKSSVLFTVLMQYNSAARAKRTASRLMIESFSKYDASEPEEITEALDLINRAKFFNEYYNIRSRKDIMSLAREPISEEEARETDLLEPDTKYFSFSKNDEEAMKFWDILQAIRFRDRGILINKMLFQYCAHGNCEFYSQFCAKRLMRWLKSELAVSDVYGKERLETIIDILLFFALPAEDEEPVAIEDDDESVEARERNLRRLLGMQ